jgi:hypothetical protein
MPCDLHRIFARLSALLPEDEDSTFVFSAATFPAVTRSLQTDRLVVEKTYRAYNNGFGDFRRDALCSTRTRPHTETLGC